MTGLNSNEEREKSLILTEISTLSCEMIFSWMLNNLFIRWRDQKYNSLRYFFSPESSGLRESPDFHRAQINWVQMKMTTTSWFQHVSQHKHYMKWKLTKSYKENCSMCVSPSCCDVICVYAGEVELRGSCPSSWLGIHTGMTDGTVEGVWTDNEVQPLLLGSVVPNERLTSLIQHTLKTDLSCYWQLNGFLMVTAGRIYRTMRDKKLRDCSICVAASGSRATEAAQCHPDTKSVMLLHVRTPLSLWQLPKCGTAERQNLLLMNIYHPHTHALEIEVLVDELNVKRRSCDNISQLPV